MKVSYTMKKPCRQLEILIKVGKKTGSRILIQNFNWNMSALVIILLELQGTEQGINWDHRWRTTPQRVYGVLPTKIAGYHAQTLSSEKVNGLTISRQEEASLSSCSSEQACEFCSRQGSTWTWNPYPSCSFPNAFWWQQLSWWGGTDPQEFQGQDLNIQIPTEQSKHQQKRGSMRAALTCW